MNFYMTFGTNEYLSNLRNEITHGELLLMLGEDNAVLMHETSEQSSFKSGKHFEVLDAVGELAKGKFAVLNNIPVSDEGRPVFEYRFSNRAGLIEKEQGFVAIRVLRPTNSDTYVILTLWEDVKYFIQWQESKAYEKAHEKRGKTNESDQKQQIFPRPSYVTTYYLEKENND
ncbi:antibiotic biosynthesis monooxygenase family protein [Sutcliffiella rhizosphaerae]|uniref:Heme-degrading monooxygenase HmoB n=1 Tax=Sutcliffiella rhizosphaerae TaxID=2880967 RepID=A0ABM8YT39_9BACI|nr:antibiotic biosynthesis monooxygenase [Sutcliffiella rhizosphaerae]CAG9622955.1 Heme-degrading monooxygenase HmoB [Sutcliffiella rhizosphaerae]